MDIDNNMFVKASDYIVAKLYEPTNRDLLHAVMRHGMEDGSKDSFMFTFVTLEKMDFDKYCDLSHLVDVFVQKISEEMGVEYVEDFRSMSVRYDEYLEQHGAIDENQSKRFDAIVEEAEAGDGWSGSVFGYVMRLAQNKINRIMSN